MPLMNKDIQAYLAEFIGTFMLVFIGAGSILANDFSKGALGLVGIAFAHGLVLMSVIYATSHISGAHINPAVTISSWAAKKIAAGKAFLYIIFQLGGATAAGFLLKVIFVSSPSKLHLGVTDVASGIPMIGAILIETILTFFLVFTIFGSTDRRAPQGMYGIAIGLVLTFDILFGGALTGASMNPARTFGPAIASDYWANHSVYWIGPIIGGVIAALVYEYIVGQNNSKKPEKAGKKKKEDVET